MEVFKFLISLISAIGRFTEPLFTRKQKQRRAAEAASRLASVLDKYVKKCADVALDNGYSPFTNPAHHDYRKRKEQCREPVLVLPVIPDWELLPLRFTDGARGIENRQEDIPDLLREAREYSDGSGDEYYAERQKIFAQQGLRAVKLSRELRNTYNLTPPSTQHRKLEAILEEKVKYHDGYSVKLRRIDRRIKRQAVTPESGRIQKNN